MNRNRIIPILLLFLFLLALAACQDTPKNPVVVGKGDGQLEKKILASATPRPEAEPPREEETAPSAAPAGDGAERVVKTITNDAGNVEVHVDAEAVRYGSQTFPAVVVAPRKFTQEQAEAIIGALVGDSLLYDPAQRSREDIEETLLLCMKKKSEAPEDQKEFYQNKIDSYKEELKDAVPESQMAPASRVFAAASSMLYTESIVGKFKRNGREYTLFVHNDDDGKCSNVEMKAVGGIVYSIVGPAPYDPASSPVSVPYERALEQARRLAEEMGADLSLEAAFVAAAFDDPSGEPPLYAYLFAFTREIDGFHTVYDSTAASFGGSEEDVYQEPWPYERLTVVINEGGVQDVDWQGPSRVEKTLNGNVAMLPFYEVLDAFERMIFIKNRDVDLYSRQQGGEGGKTVVTVDRITLGLMRVQSGNRYYLIPVWDFYGAVDVIMADGTSLREASGIDTIGRFRESLQSLLTINAIDGSVIDRSVGY